MFSDLRAGAKRKFLLGRTSAVLSALPAIRGGGAEFEEWLCYQVLKKVPLQRFVFSLPKILRRYFLYDRDLLSDLSRCAWESLTLFLRETVPKKNPIPGAAIAIQTFGDSLNISNLNR
jgi:hypothetical protein